MLIGLAVWCVLAVVGTLLWHAAHVAAAYTARREDARTVARHARYREENRARFELLS